jgi:sporulation protein YlmC with PRC-barrel domain
MRSATLRGLAIISIAEGTRLGRVDDLLIDIAERRIVALHCSDQGRRFIVPFQHVRNIGKDAITVESSQVTQIEGQGAQTPDTLRLDAFLKLKAVDESGTLVGTVSQLDIDATTGRLVSLDAHRGGVLGLGGTTTTVAAEHIRAVGPELVTVANIQPQT